MPVWLRSPRLKTSPHWLFRPARQALRDAAVMLATMDKGVLEPPSCTCGADALRGALHTVVMTRVHIMHEHTHADCLHSKDRRVLRPATYRLACLI